MESGHEARGKNPKRRFTESQEMALVCMRRTEMVAEVKGALGFGPSHHYVAAAAIWACTVHSMLPKIAECTNGPQRLWKIILVTRPFVAGTDPKFKGCIDLVTHG
jgi:hypothetical protein